MIVSCLFQGSQHCFVVNSCTVGIVALQCQPQKLRFKSFASKMSTLHIELLAHLNNFNPTLAMRQHCPNDTPLSLNSCQAQWSVHGPHSLTTRRLCTPIFGLCNTRSRTSHTQQPKDTHNGSRSRSSRGYALCVRGSPKKHCIAMRRRQGHKN